MFKQRNRNVLAIAWQVDPVWIGPIIRARQNHRDHLGFADYQDVSESKQETQNCHNADERGKPDGEEKPVELPQEVIDALKDAVPGLEIIEIEVKGNGRFYEIEGLADGVEVEVKIKSDGKIEKLNRDDEGEESEEEGEDGEGSEGEGEGDENAVVQDVTPLDVDLKDLPENAKAVRLAGSMQLKIATEPGNFYRFECLNRAGRWQPLGGKFRGNGEEKVVRVPVGRATDCTMFRVKITPIPEDDGVEPPVEGEPEA